GDLPRVGHSVVIAIVGSMEHHFDGRTERRLPALSAIGAQFRKHIEEAADIEVGWSRANAGATQRCFRWAFAHHDAGWQSTTRNVEREHFRIEESRGRDLRAAGDPNDGVGWRGDTSEAGAAVDGNTELHHRIERVYLRPARRRRRLRLREAVVLHILDDD